MSSYNTGRGCSLIWRHSQSSPASSPGCGQPPASWRLLHQGPQFLPGRCRCPHLPCRPLHQQFTVSASMHIFQHIWDICSICRLVLLKWVFTVFFFPCEYNLYVKKIFLNEGKLFYNVVLVSAVQQHESAVSVCVCVCVCVCISLLSCASHTSPSSHSSRSSESAEPNYQWHFSQK